MIVCPNCSLENADSAKFCANCGTPFVNTGSAPPPYQPASPTYQSSSGPYNPAPSPARSGNSLARNIGLGCLLFIVIFFFLGLSCTRACFGTRHRTYVQRRY